MMAGSINEPGYINGMDKKGFNHARAMSELYANPLDAHADFILCNVTEDYIDLIDNGHGMTSSGHEHLWESQRENHSSENSMYFGIWSKTRYKEMFR